MIGVDVDNDKEITFIVKMARKRRIKVKCEGEEYLTFRAEL